MYLSSLLTPWLAPLYFAAIYFVFSLSSAAQKKREMKARQQGLLYYSDDVERDIPNRFSKMRTADYEREGLIAANQGHPGGYYGTVYGGVPGDMYEAEVVASPPSHWRTLKLREKITSREDMEYNAKAMGFFGFADFNLDYSFITSELPALAEILNSQYSSGGNFFSIALNIDDESRSGLYEAYKQNTIGHIEQEVQTISNGQFDTIRPSVINGVPQYLFINSHDDFSQTTQSLTPLYSPIIVSQFRYEQLLHEGKIKDAVMTINVDGVYGNWHNNDAFNAYQFLNF